VGCGQEVGTEGRRTEVCRSNKWKDISKTNVPRDEEEGADVSGGLDLTCEEAEKAVLWRAVM